MTTGMKERTDASLFDAADDDARAGGRWAQWWASWRVAVRMARRDVRRHKGRSTLIALMVGLPVLTLVGGLTLIATVNVDTAEQTPLRLGPAVASLEVVGNGEAVQQQPVDSRYLGWGTYGKARPLPAGASTADSLQALTGGTLLRLTSGQVGMRTTPPSLIDYLGVQQEALGKIGARASLLTGRWPTSTTEIVVTPTGIAAGLPTNGPVSLHIDGKTVSLNVVGTGHGFIRQYREIVPAEVIGLPVELEMVNSDNLTPVDEYLLLRDRGVDLDEMLRLNAHGLHVVSGELTENPPDTSAVATHLPPEMMLEDAMRDPAVQQATFAAVGGVGLLLLTSLLAGPAFAVTAARQRHSLALAASNGADRRQLRRSVLGQALVLGCGATVLATLTALVGAWLIWTRLRVTQPDTFWGSFDVPLVPVAIVILAAVVSSVASALLPSRGLGKLDIIGVLKGQDVSPRLRLRTPLVGLILAAASGAAVLWAAVSNSTNVMAAGSVVLVLSTLLLVPLLLTVAARLTRHASVSLRIAMRDAARQRSRATPTVAAILAGAAALSTFLVVLATDTAVKDQFYEASTRPGYGLVRDGADPAKVIPTVARAGSSASAHLINRVETNTGDAAGTSQNIVAAVRTGCGPSDYSQALAPDLASFDRCHSLGMSYQGDGQDGILVADSAYLADLMQLEPPQRQALDRGAMLVVDGVGKPSREIRTADGMGSMVHGSATVDIVRGAVHMVMFTESFGDGSTPPQVQGAPKTVAIPAVAIPRALFSSAFPQEEIGGVLTPESAKRHGLPFGAISVGISNHGAPISASQQEALQREVSKVDAHALVYVERGFQRDDLLVILIAGGVIGFIILVATLIATALAQSEGQSMSSTLAAVGATRLTRRRIAAAQAWFLAAVGALFGVAVGAIPGIALAWQSTQSNWMAIEEGITPKASAVVPWMQLAAPVLVIPVVAGVLAWVSIRKHPTVTRRLT